MSSEKLSKFEHRPTKAMEARGMTYTNREAAIFYFENDDTNDRKDAYTLKDCLEDIFGIKSTVVEISKRDPSPAFTISDTLNLIVHRMAPARHTLPSLMIMGYVGHSAVENATVMVQFVGSDGLQRAQWRFIARQWFSEDDALENLDALAILDCCYSGTIRERHDRASQVLAACGANEIARSQRKGFINFSQRFSGACRSLAAGEHRSFTTTDEIYSEMCRLRPTNIPEPLIEHLNDSGRVIRLDFQSRRLTESPQHPLSTGY